MRGTFKGSADCAPLNGSGVIWYADHWYYNNQLPCWSRIMRLSYNATTKRRAEQASREAGRTPAASWRRFDEGREGREAPRPAERAAATAAARARPDGGRGRPSETLAGAPRPRSIPCERAPARPPTHP